MILSLIKPIKKSRVPSKINNELNRNRLFKAIQNLGDLEVNKQKFATSKMKLPTKERKLARFLSFSRNKTYWKIVRAQTKFSMGQIRVVSYRLIKNQKKSFDNVKRYWPLKNFD